MIVAESIGFAGTHTICDILAALPGYDVSHGSQHFEIRGVPLGEAPARQTPDAFAESMLRAAAEGRRPVAVHCMYNPLEFRPACARRGIRYSLLVREPVAQVESCYAWLAKKVLGGDAASFVQCLQTILGTLTGAGIAPSLPNLLYGFACWHVGTYNAVGVASGAPVLRMEAILNDEAAFRAAFDVPEAAEIAHFHGARRQAASHRAEPEVQALAAPDRAAVRQAIRFRQGGLDLSFAQLGAVLGY